MSVSLLNRKDSVSFSFLSLAIQCNILSGKGSVLGVPIILSVEQTLASNAGGCHFNSRILFRCAAVWLLLRLLTQAPIDRFTRARRRCPWDSRYRAFVAKLSWKQKSLLGLRTNRDDRRQNLSRERWRKQSQTTKRWYLQGIVGCRR